MSLFNNNIFISDIVMLHQLVSIFNITVLNVNTPSLHFILPSFIVCFPFSFDFLYFTSRAQHIVKLIVSLASQCLYVPPGEGWSRGGDWS